MISLYIKHRMFLFGISHKAFEMPCRKAIWQAPCRNPARRRATADIVDDLALPITIRNRPD